MIAVLSQHMYSKLAYHATHTSFYDCECGERIVIPITRGRSEVFAEHLAVKLEEAGYGPLV
jgi:hypothetical protein